METQVVDLTGGTQLVSGGGTVAEGDSTSESGRSFTGGLLQLGEAVSGWVIKEKMGTLSGEADIYIAEKDGQKGVVKYYRSTAKPKTEILEKIKALNHPDIVNVFDFGIYNNRFFEIMEFAAGGSLDTRNEDGSYRYLPLGEDAVVEVCKEILNAFKSCHSIGIIHRDIKPANIYYRTGEKITGGEDGETITWKGSDIVIADFGIASLMDEAEQLHKTQTSSRTTGYAAPEVLTGSISHKMDYYALGITLWELLTGKDPFVLESGKRRNDAHLIRDTIEGRIADDLLSKEPVSPRMERLIRGLLVIDSEHRWGYDEVLRHLAGEDVEVFRKQKKAWTFSVGETDCSSLEELGAALINNTETAKKYVFRGLLSSFLEDYYPDIAKKINDIAEETSAKGDYDNGILKVACLLNPGLPFEAAHGFKAQNIDDIIFLLQNAPESILPFFRSNTSKLYVWLEIIGYAPHAEEIKNLPKNISDAELAGKAEVILRNKVIKPFRLAKYADIELSTLEQIRKKIPKDMQNHILTLVAEKSYEGTFLPWLDLLTPGVSINDMDTGNWNVFLKTMAAAG
jgi:serine/threonine protein kinase